MGVVRVIDKETGQELSLDERSVQADPDAYDIVPGQVATVKPAAAEGGLLGQDVTAETLRPELAIERASADERVQATREQVESDTHDTIGNTLSQAAQGVASSLSLGVSDFALRGTTELEREDQRAARRVGDGAFQTARLVTDIATVFLPSAPLKAARFARLAPSVQLSYLTGRVAAGGTGTLGKISRTALGEAIEGAGHNVGTTLAREALEEDPQLSAETLLLAAGQGAALGGALGGAAAGLAAGARRLRAVARAGDPAADTARGVIRAAADVPVAAERSALDAVFGSPRPGARRATRRRTERPPTAPPEAAAADVFGGVVARPARDTTRFDQLLSRRAKRDTSKRLGELVAHVDDSAKASLGAAQREIPDVARRLNQAGVDRGLRDELVGDLTRLSDEFGTASAAASRWMSRVTSEIGADNLAKLTPAQVLKRLPDELEESAAEVLADLDSARAAYTAARGRVDTALQGALDVPVGASVAAGGVTGRLRARLGAGGIAETAATVAGAAELARDAGLDVPLPSVRDIPGIGNAMSLYVRFKAGANAAKRLGVLPASPATVAAGRVNSVRDRLSGVVERASRGVLKVAGTATAQRFVARSARAVIRQLSDLRSATPQQVEAEAATAVGVDPALSAVAGATARRAHEYLLSQAPTNPLAGTALADGWSPSPVQLIEWGTTSATVADPVAAIERSFTAPFPDLAIDAVRTVYPGLYAQLQADLFAERDKLRDKLPEHRLEALGRAYAVPLTTSQLPEYRAIPAAPTAPIAPAGPAPTPKGSTTSPVGTLELTGDASRQLRR